MSTNYKKQQAQKALARELDYLMKTPLGRRSFLVSAPLLLAACASVEKSRYREGDNSGQQTSMTVEDEKKMTQEVLPQMRKDYPAFKDPEAQHYLAELGNKIVRENKLIDHPYQYHFTLVDVDYVNAFALPAGEIMVTAPLLAMAETEAELAGVMGHEVGHVISRHVAERMEKEKKEQTKSILFGLGGGLLGGAAGFALGKLLCKKGDAEYKSCLQKAALYGAAAGAGGGLLIQKYTFMANSRENEMEADRVGFKTSFGAGYDKDHVGTFYAKLLEMEKKYKQGQNAALATFADALSTHPPSQERVDQMNQMAAAAKQSKEGLITTNEFQKIKILVTKQLAEKPKKKQQS